MAQSAKRPTPRNKQRRRRRRIVSIAGFALTTFGLAWFFELQATTTIMFVRHTDTNSAISEGGDQPLNAYGQARAVLLADFLQDIDVIAGIDAIYTSELKATQQTAAPLAERLGIEIEIADPYDIEPFMTHVLREHKGEIVLVVTHNDSLAALVAELHGHQSVPEIAPNEYDNLYIVTIPWFGKVKTLRLHYGIGWQPPYPSFSGR